MPFDPAARALNEDWGTRYDGKQIQRWSEHIGQEAVALRETERRAYGKGQRPKAAAGEGNLLVIGMDGGRMQSRTPEPQTKSRWVEDKVATVSHYQKGNGTGQEPERLSTTYVGTLSRSRKFGVLARVEAERQGVREIPEVLIIGDGAAWIDKIADEHFSSHPRIVDYYHVAERLGACAQAVCPGKPERLARRLTHDLYHGQRRRLRRWLEKQVRRVGRVKKKDPPNHPRRVLSENLIYFQRHEHQMNYPQYCAKGWPIGSGVTESGVKLFNKRVKGTEQFWGYCGGEAILALRALRLSQDDRWNAFMFGRKLSRAA